MNLNAMSMVQANDGEVLHAKALLLQQQLRGLSQLGVENHRLSFGLPSASQDVTTALLLKKEQETKAASLILLQQQRLLDETKMKLLSASRQHSEAACQMPSASDLAAAAALGHRPLAGSLDPFLTTHLSLLYPPVEKCNNSMMSMLLAAPEQATNFPSTFALSTRAAESTYKYDDELCDEEYFKRKSRDSNSEDDCEDDVYPDYESFPVKLYRMIYESEKNGKAELIQFSPCGQGFVIHKPEEFASDIMPQYFKTNRFSSLQRQLNLYGFQKVPDGQGKARFFHKHFLKGKRILCNKIVRKRKSKKASHSRHQ